MSTAPEKPRTEAGLSFFNGPDAPQESELYKCVHCGFCLQACPTYVETGLEAESPRGRIALMKAVNEGRIGITDSVMRHWDLCIQCRACEVACPSGVPYGNLIEATMQQVADRREPSFINDKIESLALKRLLPNQGLLSMVVGSMRLYQRLGVQKAMRKSGLLKLLPGNMGELEESLPQLPSEVFKARGQHYRAKGDVKARVALLSGCVMPLIHGPEMNAVVRVLTRNGCDVVVPKAQVCCGAINSHVGDLETARELARENVDAFLAEDVDYVAIASAGCGARMKEYDHLLKDDSAYAEKAKELSAKVRDIHELLADLPIEAPKGHLPYRVTYQDSCHLLNAQRVSAAPRQLLHSIPGIEFAELSNADKCCGAGGTYTITERDFSMRILDTKMRTVRDTKANVIATANPGCLMQLQYGAQRDGMDVQVKYVTDLLDESYRKE